MATTNEWSHFRYGSGEYGGLDADRWAIDGREVIAGEGISLTPTTLTLAFDAARDAIAHWRQYDRPGDFAVISRYGGGWRIEPSDLDAQPVQVAPPPGYHPPLAPTTDWHVASYDEQQAAADRYRITLALRRPTPRQGVFTPLNQAGGAWNLDFNSGGRLALAADQVGQASATGTTAGGDWTLPLILGDREAATIADVAGVPDAIVTRAVPGGDDLRTDTSSGRQTVSVSTPATSGFSGGSYLVTGWTLTQEGFGDRRWACELSLAE